MILTKNDLMKIILLCKDAQKNIIIFIIDIPSYELKTYRAEYITYLYTIKICKFFINNNQSVYSNQFIKILKSKIYEKRYSNKVLYRIINSLGDLRNNRM